MESSCVGVFFNKVAGPQNCSFIKKGIQRGFLLWALWIIQEHLFCVEDLSTAGSETPVRLFKNTFFYRTFPVAASDSFRFPLRSFIKKGTPVKTFLCEFC